MNAVNKLNGELQRLSVSQHGSEIYVSELQQLIKGSDGADGYAAHERFAQICNLADLSFPQGTPSSEEIRENPSTLLLMTFLLKALRSYRTRDAQTQRSTTTQRRELLASCFGLDIGKQGGNTRGKKWTSLKEQEFLSTFTQLLSDNTDKESWVSAFLKTYELAFGTDTFGGRHEVQIMKNRVQLDTLLAEHGYGAKQFEVNLKMVVM